MIGQIDDFLKMMETFLMSAASSGMGFCVKSGAAVLSASRLGVATQKTASVIATSTSSSVKSSYSSMKNFVIQKFSSKVSSAGFDAVAAGQKQSTTSSALTKFLSNERLKFTTKNTLVSTIKKTGFKTLQIVYNAKNAGEYANGKLYVMRGGPKITDDGNSREEPLRLELYEQNKRLSLESCECLCFIS
jgi:hypothetical protein